MARWNTIWSFSTARFTVSCDWEHEQSPDVSWADPEILEQLESGELTNVTFRVRVLLDGREVSCAYLGNSVYADPVEFVRENIGIRAKSRADGLQYGSYFHDMLHEAVAEARKAICDAPRLRCS